MGWPVVTRPTTGQPAIGADRPVEPPSGPTPEAAPVAPTSATERSSGRMWIGWLLALLVIAVVVAVAYVVYGLSPLFITTTVPLAVAEVGVVLVLLALLVTAGRHRARRAVERARREAQQEAWARHQQFLRRLDHELKNPLTAVRAAVADLPQAHPQELQTRVDVVDAQARRMGRLVTDLRKLADLETAALSLEDVDIAETVQDAAQAVSEENSTRDGAPTIRLDLPRVPWPLSHVRGDGDLLYSAIYNVISNAAKYTGPGGAVEVRGREDTGTVTIEVADTGIGVPQADLPAVWSELARAGNARGLPGSGLGLALVATIVRRHGGSVRMASREGVGTRVWLSLPVAGPLDTP
ncbi:HAMP domain-containing sensor histidine kinase [uncultured Actinomyces sp.]|uniref:sensor histidine kinase n=1 Tax=uncultured Actinomyces sp. TaxID=249061 RepID=UPI0025F56772|nr:HAMP domain-containing sensor histidine kinase [uncultured Actinomyces sp.]